MNWGEFKKAVEKQGVAEDDDLLYIDVSFIHVKDADDVSVDKDNGYVSIA